MRPILALTFLGLAGCRDNASAKPEPAANAATASASASASASATASAAAPAPASSESPPAVTSPARSDIATTADEEKPVVLEGIYFAPEEARRGEADEAACADPVTLERPVRVLDKAGKPLKDGRGTGAHPTIGDATKRVCLWSFKGYEPGRQTMLPRGSRVTFRGKLSGPMTRQHPRAILVLDVEVLSAVPAPTAAPPDAFPDGDSVVFVRKVDAATRTLGLDLAYLYYGDAAEKLATERGEKLPSGQRWYIANDSPQLRSLVLAAPGPTSVGPKRLGDGRGDGWRPVALDELNRAPATPYIVTFEGGVLKDFRQITFGGATP